MSSPGNTWGAKGLMSKKPAQKKKAPKRYNLIRRIDIQVAVLGKDLQVEASFPGRLVLSPLFSKDFSALTIRILLSQAVEQGRNLRIEMMRPEGKITMFSEVIWCLENPNFTQILSQYAYPFRTEVMFKKNLNSNGTYEPAPNISQELFQTFFKKAG